MGLFSLLGILLIAYPVQAQVFQLGVLGGMAKVTDDANSNWNMGYNFGAQTLLGLGTTSALVGLRASYTRFAANEDQWREVVGGLINGKVSGHLNLVEIVPVIRAGTHIPIDGVSLFGQGGAGLFIENSEVTVSGNVLGADFKEIFKGETRGRFTVQAGGGLAFGGNPGLFIELMPLYHWGFPMDKTVDFYTLELNLGFRF